MAVLSTFVCDSRVWAKGSKNDFLTVRLTKLYAGGL